MHKLIRSLRPKVPAESSWAGRSTPNPHKPQRERERCQNTASILYVFTTPKVLLHLLNVGKNKEITTGHFSPIRLAGELDHRSLETVRETVLSQTGEGRPAREPHTRAYPMTPTPKTRKQTEGEWQRGEKKWQRDKSQRCREEKKNKCTKHLRCW